MCFETFLVIKTPFPLSFCNRKKKRLLGTITTHVWKTIQLCIKTYLVVICLVVSVVVICAKGYSIVRTNVTCERKTSQLWTLSL